VHDLLLLTEVLNPTHCVLDLHGLPPFLMIDALLEEILVFELIDALLNFSLLLIALIFFKR
jgi:hypothetical protein